MEYTAKEICKLLGIPYPNFQQYVHYWRINPVRIEGKTRYFDEECLQFIKERTNNHSKKKKEWYLSDKLMPILDTEFSELLCLPVSVKCEVRGEKSYGIARFDFLNNCWFNETNKNIPVRVWNYLGC